MKKFSNILKAVIISVLLLIILIFSFQNLDPVSVDFFNMKSKEIPLFIILMGVLIFGILIGYLLGLISGSKIAQNKLEKLAFDSNEKIANAEEKAIKFEKQLTSNTANKETK